MFKIDNIKEMLIISSIAGIFSELISSINISYIILLLFSGLDTLTGIWGAVKYRRFTSKGLGKLVRKVIIYTACIATVRLLEIGVADVVQTTVISQVMVSFLMLVEAVSILENLAFLGAPLPANLIKYLIGKFNIPGLEYIIKFSRAEQTDIEEIEEIIKYQVASFKDKYIRMLLEIKFTVWINIIKQVNAIFAVSGENDKEVLYYKVMFIIETSLKEMQQQWHEQGIPETYISKFTKGHQAKFDVWLNKIKQICYSSEPIMDKREKFMDNTKIIIYQTIIDAHREFS